MDWLPLVIRIVVIVFAAPILGGLLSGIDRKITAKMQRRKGPPLLQPFYDVSKLIGKESKSSNKLTKLYVSLCLLFTAASVVFLFIGIDILLAVFAFTLACVFFVLVGYSAYSPYAFVGAERELIQIMCYEPMILLVAFGLYKVNGSFATISVTEGFSPLIFKLPLVFIGLLFILTVKMRKSPFDLSTSHHAHQEIVSGVTTELTGKCLARIKITHWYETIYALALVFMFFVTCDPKSYIVAGTVTFLVFVLESIIDNIFARVKFKPALKICWIVTISLSFINFLALEILSY